MNALLAEGPITPTVTYTIKQQSQTKLTSNQVVLGPGLGQVMSGWLGWVGLVKLAYAGFP